MKLGKLKKQLVRDLKGNPKKAAILGVLILVAGWFWAPLILGTSKKKTPAKTEQASVAIAPTEAVPDPAAASTVVAAPKRTWRQLVEEMEKDAWMSPAEVSDLEMDPFAAPVATTEPEPVVEQPEPEPTPVAKDITPEDMGLKLTGTLIGARGGVAIINGRSYGVGSQIVLDDGVTFVVAEVSHKQAVLERDGKRYLIETAPVAGTGAFEVRRTAQ